MIFFYPFYSSDFISWLDSASIASLDHSHCYSNKEKHLALLHAGREAKTQIRESCTECSALDPGPSLSRGGENPLGLTQPCRALTTPTALPWQAESNEGKLGALLAWWDTAGNAAATSGLLWARSGFLGWPTKTQHTKDPVL